MEIAFQVPWKLCADMDAMFDICYLSPDGNNVEPDDIPKTKENVWILGRKYSPVQGKMQSKEKCGNEKDTT